MTTTEVAAMARQTQRERGGDGEKFDVDETTSMAQMWWWKRRQSDSSHGKGESDGKRVRG
jgi:hypothetical protein